MLITNRNRKYFFIPILILTTLSVVPLVNLLRGGLQFEASQKTRLTAFLVIPGVPVFSTDDFFEYVFFEAETSAGKRMHIKWQELVDNQYKNNFLNYVYMRHVFNTRKNAGRSKKALVSWALKNWICNHPEKFQLLRGETITAAEYFVSFPLERQEIKDQIRVNCNEQFE